MLEAAGAKDIRMAERAAHAGASASTRWARRAWATTRAPQSSRWTNSAKPTTSKNLFVTDGAVYPSMGTVNPTLTMMANTRCGLAIAWSSAPRRGELGCKGCTRFTIGSWYLLPERRPALRSLHVRRSPCLTALRDCLRVSEPGIGERALRYRSQRKPPRRSRRCGLVGRIPRRAVRGRTAHRRPGRDVFRRGRRRLRG